MSQRLLKDFCIPTHTLDLMDAYVNRYDPSSSEGETSAPIAPLSVQMERWTEMVGGERKGRIFDLAGMASQRFPRALTDTPSEREQQLEAELEAVKSQLEAQTSTVDAMKAQVETLTQFILSMQQQQPSLSSSFPRPTADIPYPTTVVRLPYPHPSRQYVQCTSSSACPPINPPLFSPCDVDHDSDEIE